MIYRYLVKQPDLNAHGTLHGGVLMQWVDESCGMEAQIATKSVCATRYMGDIDFIETARVGDILEVITSLESTGKTSITFRAKVRRVDGTVIANFTSLVFVAIDENHNPIVH